MDLCGAIVFGVFLLFTTTTMRGSGTTAAIATLQSGRGEITNITTAMLLYDKRVLQLQVDWMDTLSDNTSYNIIVSPMNLTDCPDLPCSVYGVSNPKRSIVIPENPVSYLEMVECKYMFGCNYTLTVESSNAFTAGRTTLVIPYCVAGVCSCRHAPNLPKVFVAANIPNNNTINLLWSIKVAPNVQQSELSAMQIYLKLSEQTNPSVSWGGKLIPISESVYNIIDVSSDVQVNDMLQGKILLKIKQPLIPKTVLNLNAYVIDDLRCPGPGSIVRIPVPVFHQPEATRVEHGNDLRTGLIIISVFFFCTVAAALAVGMVVCKRREKATHAHMPNGLLSPLAMVEMEENVNYVDKDVHEAQAAGIADVFEVPHRAVQLGPAIGEGAFGRVYKATATNLRRMRGTTLVAVKQLKKNPTADEVAEFLSEIEMLKGVGTHNNIVCFLGCCTIRPPYFMIMEYVGRGDLLSYLRTVRYNGDGVAATGEPPIGAVVKYIELKMSTDNSTVGSNGEARPQMPSLADTMYTIIDDDEYNEPFQYILDHKELHNFALQIANGMRFLEEQEITHRDLAARNVLIDDRKTLKISDFGLSRHGIYTNTKTRKLPLRWLSLEAIRDNIYSSQSDVWAYGVVLWEIGTLGASPYPGLSNHELIPYLMSGKRLDKPEICTERVYSLMLQCWTDEPILRPTFEQLCRALNQTAYVDISSLSDDYVFPPIHDNENHTL